MIIFHATLQPLSTTQCKTQTSHDGACPSPGSLHIWCDETCGRPMAQAAGQTQHRGCHNTHMYLDDARQVGQTPSKMSKVAAPASRTPPSHILVCNKKNPTHLIQDHFLRLCRVRGVGLTWGPCPFRNLPPTVQPVLETLHRAGVVVEARAPVGRDWGLAFAGSGSAAADVTNLDAHLLPGFEMRTAPACKERIGNLGTAFRNFRHRIRSINVPRCCIQAGVHD